MDINIKKSGKLTKDIALNNQLGKQFIIKIIADLIQEGVEEQEIKEKLLNGYVFKVDESISVNIKDYFKSPLENAINDKNFYVATILAATIIEHNINEFYTSLYKSKFNFSNTKIDKILRADLEDKLSWLFLLSTGFTIDDNSIHNIKEIAKKRNSIVHYKPKELGYELFDNTYIRIIKDSIKLIDFLDSELYDVLYEVIAVLKEAKVIYYKLFSDKTQIILKN